MIPIPAAAKVEIQAGVFTVAGPKGKLSQRVPPGVEMAVEDGAVRLQRQGDTGPERARHGLVRALLANAVLGVTQGWKKELEVVGVGYRGEVKEGALHLSLGFSHPVVYPVPENIKIEIDRQNRITITGPDRQQVGQVAAELRALRPPDAYKGKGIRYAGEVLKLKVGKAAASGGTA
jgi:large subunit ribosomal protein L6